MPVAGATLPAVDELFEHAPCGLMLTSEDGTIRRVNETFCGWTGRSPQALVDRLRLSDLLTMGGRLFHQTHWAPLLQMQGSVAEVKLEIVHADGRRVPMLLNALRRRHGEAVYHEVATLIVTDRHRYEQELLHERKKAEAALDRLNESQLALRKAEAEAAGRALFAEQMMGIVSHDLRNPLSAVLMSAHALGMTELSTNQMRAVSRIVSASNRAQRLIADLLDFTQARLGHGLSVVPADVSLHELVAVASDELMSAFPGRRLVHVRLGEGRCAGDADRLTQLLGNLVSNAFSYGAPEHPVTVTTEVRPSRCRIAVHNAGPPIPAEMQPSLFEPMQRGDQAGAVRSVGLGLFIVSEIAKAHGGRVEVRSTAAEGTTFSVELPATPAR
jgi:sigma-B regulation protein RsbU (phosphoserine phosphatase)